MLSLKFDDNFEVVKNYVTETPAIVFGEITKGVDRATNDLRNKIILAMRNTPRTGKKRTKPGGGIHIASSRGNAPAPETGNLLRSIRKDRYKRGEDSFFVVGVGSEAPYAQELEDPKIHNRPIIRKILAQERPKIENMLTKILARSTEGVHGSK
jgi:hypothetical protein